jgi:hypothetical protein
MKKILMMVAIFIAINSFGFVNADLIDNSANFDKFDNDRLQVSKEYKERVNDIVNSKFKYADIKKYINVRVVVEQLGKVESDVSGLFMGLMAAAMSLFFAFEIREAINKPSVDRVTNFIAKLALIIFVYITWDGIFFLATSLFDILGESLFEGSSRGIDATLDEWASKTGGINVFKVGIYETVSNAGSMIAIIMSYVMKQGLFIIRTVVLALFYMLFRPLLVLWLLPIDVFKNYMKKFISKFVAVLLWPFFIGIIDIVFYIFMSVDAISSMEIVVGQIIIAATYYKVLKGIPQFAESLSAEGMQSDIMDTLATSALMKAKGFAGGAGKMLGGFVPGVNIGGNK